MASKQPAQRKCHHCGESTPPAVYFCRHCKRDLSRPKAVTGATIAVPFVPEIGIGYPAIQAADILSEQIERWRLEGWRFVRLESLTTVRSNGCLAGLLGNGQSVFTFQLAILEQIPPDVGGPKE